MENVETIKWLQRGSQRSALATIMLKPMTGSELCAAAQALHPKIKIHLRDVWFIMREFQKRGLAICLNPKQITGRLYCLTDEGRKIVAQAFKVKIQPVPQNIDWKQYSFVVRAKIRKLTLLTFAQLAKNQPATISEIRKYACEEHPVALNPVIRAVKELCTLKLLTVSGMKSDGRSLYRLTPKGRQIADQLNLYRSDSPKEFSHGEESLD